MSPVSDEEIGRRILGLSDHDISGWAFDLTGFPARDEYTQRGGRGLHHTRE